VIRGEFTTCNKREGVRDLLVVKKQKVFSIHSGVPSLANIRLGLK
jgi:hypothetical protein